LFGTFNYGGASSPFLPWLIVALLLGFFYLSDRTAMVLGVFAANFAVFVTAYFWIGFPEIVTLHELEALGWMSILSATVYMSWMAIYYASVMTMRSELEIEAEHHRKTADNLAETKRRADEASRSKSIFLAKMSHEFRTPLNAIIGYSELVLESIADDKNGSDQTISDLKRVNSSGRHLLALINDILDLSKIESDTVELVKSEFDLGRFAADLVQTVEPMAAKNGNAVELQCPNRVDPTWADETKLRQILLNLLSNACKFTKNGVITLTVKQQKTVDRDWIEFRVADTGIGISAEDLKKLFTNYQQASTRTSRNYGGTGLGLAISQKLSAFMGGNISVASEPGRGSVFTVRLPVEKAPERPSTADVPISAPLTFATA
jgi:signal transduction histidine kinase